MKTIKVCGSGCKRCDAVEGMVKSAASEVGLEITNEKA